MFVGYFDDSGTHKGSPVGVVGGFVAHPTQWLGFNYRWKTVLGKYGVAVHRQSKWSNRAKPFDDPEVWPDERRHAYINELIDVIVDRDAVTIGAAVPIARLDARFPDHAKYLSPFRYAAECVFGNAARVMKQLVPDARIAYVFESGTQHLGELQQAFNEYLQNPSLKEEFGLISFATADKRDLMQLQAADIMAYEVYKLFEKGEDPGLLNPRHPLKQIGNRLQHGSWMTPSDDVINESGRIVPLAKIVKQLEELGLL